MSISVKICENCGFRVETEYGVHRDDIVVYEELHPECEHNFLLLGSKILYIDELPPEALIRYEKQ